MKKLDPPTYTAKMTGSRLGSAFNFSFSECMKKVSIDPENPKMHFDIKHCVY